MAWPDWLESIRTTYGSGAASVFVVHGDRNAVWSHEGVSGDALTLAARMLEGTRDVIGSWTFARGLTFHTPHDGMRFRRHVEARRLAEGRVQPLVESDPWDALALIWLAATWPGLRQAYFVHDTHRLAPKGSRAGRWQALPAKAPPFDRWPADAALREHDALVLAFVDLDKARPELAELPGVAVVAVPTPPPPAPAADPAPASPPADAQAALDPVPAASLGAPPALSPTDPELSIRIGAALTEACTRLAPGPWPDLAPAHQALGTVLESMLPDRVPAGTGAASAQRWLNEDISARLSAETALDSIAAGEPVLDAAAAALARRLLRHHGLAGAPTL